jgi:hypothetical protein
MSFIREPDAEPIPGYRLIEPLGSGGFGEAWKCEAPGGLFKAIKFVFGNLNSLDVDGARAEQELHALNRVKEVRHPFILSMDRIEVVAGELVIVMELADKSLYDSFQESLAAGLVGIPRDTLLRYIRVAAEALDHMNERHNLQHLDIKPRNLFLVSDRVKVADFGLVKHLERSGASLLGGVTPLYAPPETFSGTISGRSDQYSLAIVYQELLTGQRPFNGKNARTLAHQHQNEEPELRALPEAERPVLARALAKDPAKRFPNCLAFVRALYTARTPARPEAVAGAGGDRPKTLVDTMENMPLEQMPADDNKLVPVDLNMLLEQMPADGKGRSAAGPGFRSLGTYGVWFPRGLLLRLAARGACSRLFGEWQAAGEPTAREELEVERDRVLSDAELLPEALATRVSELASTHLEGSPSEVLTRLLAGVEEHSQQSVAQEDPGAWARQALVRVQEWLGGGLPPPGASTLQQRKSRLTKALESAATQLAAEWEARLGELVAGLLESPGRRLAVGEAALAQFVKYCDEASTAQAGRLQQRSARSQQAQEQLQGALEVCVEGAGGFSWFGGRSRRALRAFVDHLAAFARQCLAEDVQAAVLQFYAFLRGRLGDRLRDLTFYRQRLRHMQENLDRVFPVGGPEDTSALAGTTLPGAPHDWAAPPTRGGVVDVGASAGPTPIVSAESFWEALRDSTTMRVVLPAGAKDLEEAAAQFLTTLKADHWTQLDQVIQDQVLSPRGGLQRACLGTADLHRHLTAPMLTQAVACLSDHLPVTDVAQVEFSLGAEVAGRIRDYHAQALPLLRPHEPEAAPEGRAAKAGSGLREKVAVGGPSSAGWEDGERPTADERPRSVPEVPAQAEDQGFLLIPTSDQGKHFGEEAQKALPGVHLVNVPGQADLMFCRDQGGLTLEDLEKVLASCRAAYREMAVVPQMSPHARFDIQDWVPLDP